MSNSNGQTSSESGWQPPVVCRGVRGATTVDENSKEAILDATRELLAAIIKLNGIRPEDVASTILTATLDLNAEYPAVAARQLGWHDVPLLCAHEMAVPHGLSMCIRVLVMWNTTLTQAEIRHVYIKGATNLRPDRSIEMSELISEIADELAQFSDEGL